MKKSTIKIVALACVVTMSFYSFVFLQVSKTEYVANAKEHIQEQTEAVVQQQRAKVKAEVNLPDVSMMDKAYHFIQKNMTAK